MPAKAIFKRATLLACAALALSLATAPGAEAACSDPAGPKVDWSNCDLRSRHLTDVNLSGADLRRAVLRRANLTGANRSHANLAGADLTSANLRDAILYKVAAKPLRNFFQDRSEGIRKSLADAEKARQNAERQLEEQRSKVADLEVELNRVRDVGEKERQEMHARLQTEQEAQANRLLEQTRNAIELEVTKARAELRDRAAELALGLAEDTLRKNIGPDDQDRFVSGYLSRLENGGEGIR